MPHFIPGLELSRRFYWEVVRPILDARLPGLPHAAARIGRGSEVLGYDTEMSMDHDWGPAVAIFVRDADAGLVGRIAAAMDERLPDTFAGFPVLVTAGADGPDDEPPDRHRVVASTLRAFVRDHVGFEPDAPLGPADWLITPSQGLLELTTGAVHHDGVGELAALRQKLAYYPHDVWLYLLGSGWQRVGQEEHLMARAGHVGDELGSAVIAARLARDVMALCFLMERRYAPYPKWFGTAFRELRCAAEVGPLLWRALRAEAWPERAEALSLAYVALARMHNRLGLTPPVRDEAMLFFDRPFPVIYGGLVADALRAAIADPAVQQIAARGMVGGIDQWSDSTDLLANVGRREALRALYAGAGSAEEATG